MSAIAHQPNEFREEGTAREPSYLNDQHTIASWLLTGDHKRIAIMYLITITIFFFIGSLAAGLIRAQLVLPANSLLEAETYNKVFTAHGVVMIFFFLIVAIPAVFGNFLIPLMLGAKDLAFPRLNLLSYYLFLIGALCATVALLTGGIETGWTFYVPLSSMYSSGQVTLALVGVFIAGFSSIATAVNFVATIHKMRAPGLTWNRLPLFIWAHYATSLVILLGTPVVAITLLLVVFERVFRIGIFSPELGGDPVLFQHLFWFYSHPAVYIMVLPAMGVISELISTFSYRRIFGYEFIAFSSLLIAALGFLVWGHHMFITSQSMYQSVVFSLISFLVAVPSAIKIFNWSTTLYKGHIRLAAPMVYALGFIGLFTLGGLTGLYLACLGTDVHLTNTYFVVAHFHYVMVGGSVLAFLGALHYWWPKMTGRMYNEYWAKINALLVFIGFNLTFFPQFILGFLGMPRRYAYYYFAPQYQPLHIMSSLGSTVLALAFAIPAVYLIHSLKHGKRASDNPWGATSLEWQTQSPPISHNFHETPVVTGDIYEYHHIPEVRAIEESDRAKREADAAAAGGKE